MHKSRRVTSRTDTLSSRLDLLGPLLPIVSARILNTSPDKIDEVINSSLREILQCLGLERGALLHVSQENRKVVVAHAWYGEGVSMVSSEVNLAELMPWNYHQLVVAGKAVAKHNFDSIPAEAELDRKAFEVFGVKSALAIPLFVGERVQHIIAVHSLKEECLWPQSFILNLRMLGEIFTGALARCEIIKAHENSKERLEMAAVAADIGFWEIDLETRKIWLSTKARELLDFNDAKEVTALSFLKKIHPDDRGRLLRMIRDVQKVAKTEIRAEYRLANANGASRWMVSRGQVKPKIGKPGNRLMGVLAEITRRKVMERKLVEHVQEINRLRERLEQENALLRDEVGGGEKQSNTLGASRAMLQVKRLVDQVAKTSSTVLIQGETGTGKELVAQAIHQSSDRGKRLMVTVNCAALPAALIESELFGREKGAYTGAFSRQAGRFELAHQSTLFLDEIAEMPLETQAKLLRVLQDGTFERLGSSKKLMSDVRIIAATNRDLAAEVEQGKFRSDLYYRLNIFPIHVPPLRERSADIPLLTWKFLNEFGLQMGRKINAIAKRDMEMLMAYAWPGNVRELRNVIERAMITSSGNTLDLSHMDLPKPCHCPSDIRTLVEVERSHIIATLQVTRGKVKGQGGAAELLGLHPSTLYSRMRKLSIDPVKKAR